MRRVNQPLRNEERQLPDYLASLKTMNIMHTLMLEYPPIDLFH